MLQIGNTALHWAAVWDDAEVAKILVNYGAAMDIRNNVILSYIYTKIKKQP